MRAGQVNKITEVQHITLQPPEAGMACGFLGQGRLCSLSWVLKEKLIKQAGVKRKEERGMDWEEKALRIVHPRMYVGGRR